MKQISLDGAWTLRFMGKEIPDAKVPGSVYATLLQRGLMEDPYYRDNELKALKLMENDCEYELRFECDTKELQGDPHILAEKLVFEGVDTLATVSLNGTVLGNLNNMHRTWAFDVGALLKNGENRLCVKIFSPTKYIREENEEVYTGGSHDAMEGFPHLRKAHCMFGWDWGPRLPDMGIFRSVYLQLEAEAVLEDLYITQEHIVADKKRTDVILHFSPKIRFNTETDVKCIYTVKFDDGRSISSDSDEITIEDAKLWWPNGYGDQPLYTVTAALVTSTPNENDTESSDACVLDVVTKRIGLRTMTVNRTPDEWGESFAHEVNGITVFAMGADYIPEDNILSRVTRERTEKLLRMAAEAHHNCIRVWGGGYYPDDWFYDICDELGLMVWQDFMFACASYELDDEFDENIRAEVRDNVRRIRHHACLALWCGNNEMETQTLDGCWKPSVKQKADYLKIFEYIIPRVLKEEDPQTFYWPSSPSSGGNFENPWDENRGDTHYWDVWHGNKPFTEYRKFFFRYLSEFGFQSFPDMKTIESFTLPKDRNVFSRVMEMHQRNVAANGKITNYLSATYLYPYSLERFVYLSQLLQAEAIRYGVEHFRRNRGRCMGTVVWQLNDIWPVASWSGIDYYGRPKALHYMERRMFNPVLLSCEEHGEIDQKPFCVTQQKEIRYSFRLNVSNETLYKVSGRVEWQLRDSFGTVLLSDKENVTVRPQEALWLKEIDLTEAKIPGSETGRIDPLEHYVSYEFIPFPQKSDEKAFETSTPESYRGTALFTAPKHFKFKRVQFTVKPVLDSIRITSDVFAKNIRLECPDDDVIFSDNYFDMNPGTVTVKILSGKPHILKVTAVNTEEELIIKL